MNPSLGGIKLPNDSVSVQEDEVLKRMPRTPGPNVFSIHLLRTTVSLVLLTLCMGGSYACSESPDSSGSPKIQHSKVTRSDFPEGFRVPLDEALGGQSLESLLSSIDEESSARISGAFDYELPPLVAYAMRRPEDSIHEGTVDGRLVRAIALANTPDGGVKEPSPLSLLRQGDPDDLRGQIIRAFLEGAGISASQISEASEALRDKIVRVDGFIADDARRRESPETQFLDWDLKATTLTAFAAKIGLLTDELVSHAEKPERSNGRLLKVLVIGPGIDVVNQHLGALAPVATYQPWELAASLFRHKWVQDPKDIELHTLEINPSIQEHLVRAHERARAGVAYPGVLFAFAKESDLFRNDVTKYVESIMEPFEALGAAPLSLQPPRDSLRVSLSESYRRHENDQESEHSARRARLEWFLCTWPAFIVRQLRPILGNMVTDRFAPNESYDLVLCTNVLRYYADPALTLALLNLVRVLRPDGYFITTYPSIRARAKSVGLEFIDTAHRPKWDEQYLLRRRSG